MGYRIPGIFGTVNQESEDGETILFISLRYVIWGKKKSQVYEQFSFLKKLLLKLNHIIEGITTFSKDLQILAYIYRFFFSKFCFLGKVVVQYFTEYFCVPPPYVLGKNRWH